MKNVIVVQHIQCEAPGPIAEALEVRKISARSIRVFNGDPVPRQVSDAAGLVVMGGPMGVYEQSPMASSVTSSTWWKQPFARKFPCSESVSGASSWPMFLGAEVKPR